MSASTSVVTRVTRRPTGIAIVEGEIQALQVRHQLAAQIEHGLLSDPLHEVLLAEVAEHRRRRSTADRGTKSAPGRSTASVGR